MPGDFYRQSVSAGGRGDALQVLPAFRKNLQNQNPKGPNHQRVPRNRLCGILLAPVRFQGYPNDEPQANFRPGNPGLQQVLVQRKYAGQRLPDNQQPLQQSHRSRAEVAL